MKIRLLMLVERDPQGRFTGVIFQEGQVRPGCFFGTAELVKVMEEALPLERPSWRVPGTPARVPDPAERPSRQAGEGDG